MHLINLGPKLAKGSYGQLHSAIALDGEVKVKVAVKHLEPNFYGLTSIIEPCIMLSALHPHLAKCYSVEIDGRGRIEIVQPLANSDLTVIPLAERVKHFKKWAWQLITALAALHYRHIIHADIKPNNVLMFPEGVVLSDFSVSAFIASGKLGKLGKVACYVEAYRAPEVYEAIGGACLASDIWALGCLFYWMLYGITMQIRSSLLPKEARLIEINSYEDEIIDKMLQLNVEDRITIDGLLEHPYFADCDKQLIPKRQPIRNELVSVANCEVDQLATNIYRRVNKNQNGCLNIAHKLLRDSQLSPHLLAEEIEISRVIDFNFLNLR